MGTYALDNNGKQAERTLISPATGIVTTRTIIFNSETDDGLAYAPATGSDVDLVVAAGVVTKLSGFGTGKKRARVTMHFEDGLIPMVWAVLMTLNGGDAGTAATRLSITDITNGTGSIKGQEATVDTRKRILSRSLAIGEWDLTDQNATVDDLYLVGLASNGTGAGVVILHAEIW